MKMKCCTLTLPFSPLLYLLYQAFGSDDAFKKMDAVREQQEELARLHFRLGTNNEKINLAYENVIHTNL